MAEHIGLAAARGAGAMATQEFKGKLALGAVIPGDREFGADFLDGCGLEWRRHVFSAGGFGDVRRFEVNGFRRSGLGGAAGKVDGLRGGKDCLMEER